MREFLVEFTDGSEPETVYAERWHPSPEPEDDEFDAVMMYPEWRVAAVWEIRGDARTRLWPMVDPSP